MRIAVTGGAGYIGSHTVVLLLEAGHDVLIIDSFANAELDVPQRIATIAGRTPKTATIDITDCDALEEAIVAFKPDAVVHFAGLKAVGEAKEIPLEYYRVNVGGSIALIQAMQAANCKQLVFSSSATVYGEPLELPISEAHPRKPTNPYGQTKSVVEQIIEDWGAADPELGAINLRYFNPVGAHPSGQIGESPRGIPNNLMPYVAQVASGEREKLSVFGDDYDTPDGYGVRDYIHVLDLAAAHLSAIELTKAEKGVEAINIGTGRGYSVLDMVRAFEAASGQKIPYVVTDRRPGDVGTLLADPKRAFVRLGWQAQRDLDVMCADAWHWQSGCLRNSSPD